MASSQGSHAGNVMPGMESTPVQRTTDNSFVGQHDANLGTPAVKRVYTCTAYTAKGTRCKCKTKAGYTKCSKHLEMERIVSDEPKSQCAARAAKLFAAFNALQNEPDFKKFVTAMYAVRKRFPPKKNINKFATGGAVEELLTRMIQYCGMTCTNVSSTETLIDIRVKDGEEEEFAYSVKSIQKYGSTVILQNYRGQKRAIETLPPTILVILEARKLTLAYMDEELVQRTGVPVEKMYTHADSNLSMKGAFVTAMLRRHLSQDLVLELPVPEIPPLAEEDISKLIVDDTLRLL